MRVPLNQRYAQPRPRQRRLEDVEALGGLGRSALDVLGVLLYPGWLRTLTVAMGAPEDLSYGYVRDTLRDLERRGLVERERHGFESFWRLEGRLVGEGDRGGGSGEGVRAR